jgi:hypothetical protein
MAGLLRTVFSEADHGIRRKFVAGPINDGIKTSSEYKLRILKNGAWGKKRVGYQE